MVARVAPSFAVPKTFISHVARRWLAWLGQAGGFLDHTVSPHSHEQSYRQMDLHGAATRGIGIQCPVLRRGRTDRFDRCQATQYVGPQSMRCSDAIYSSADNRVVRPLQPA